MSEEYKKCIAIIINNLEPEDEWDFRPMSYQLTSELARFARLVYDGSTCEEARIITSNKE
jgi:hypothetical protein